MMHHVPNASLRFDALGRTETFKNAFFPIKLDFHVVID